MNVLEKIRQGLAEHRLRQQTLHNVKALYKTVFAGTNNEDNPSTLSVFNRFSLASLQAYNGLILPFLQQGRTEKLINNDFIFQYFYHLFNKHEKEGSPPITLSELSFYFLTYFFDHQRMSHYSIQQSQLQPLFADWVRRCTDQNMDKLKRQENPENGLFVNQQGSILVVKDKQQPGEKTSRRKDAILLSFGGLDQMEDVYGNGNTSVSVAVAQKTLAPKPIIDSYFKSATRIVAGHPVDQSDTPRLSLYSELYTSEQQPSVFYVVFTGGHNDTLDLVDRGYFMGPNNQYCYQILSDNNIGSIYENGQVHRGGFQRQLARIPDWLVRTYPMGQRTSSHTLQNELNK